MYLPDDSRIDVSNLDKPWFSSPLAIHHGVCWDRPGTTDTQISEKHWMRKPYAYGGLPRLKVRGINQKRGMGQRPMALSKANAILDGFWAAYFWGRDAVFFHCWPHNFWEIDSDPENGCFISELWQVCMMPWNLGRREVDPLWWSYAAVWDWQSERHYETFKTGVSMKLKPYMKPFGQILKIGRVDGH